MVRREGLAKKDVFDAASQLRAMGKPVTALKILAMLGGGSLTTIYRYLEQWHETTLTTGNTTDTVINTTIDTDEIPVAVVDAFRSAWKLALTEAEKQCASKTELEEQIKMLGESLASIREEKDRWAQREAHLLGQIEALKAANEALLSRIGKKGGKKR